MRDGSQLYIGGAWVDPAEPQEIEVVDPATEVAFAEVRGGSEADVDRAVAAAKEAFPTYATTSKAERIALLQRILDCYRAREDAIAETISKEMGAPISLAKSAQAPMGAMQLENAISVLTDFEFQTRRGSSILIEEPIGVCALITPWNWPMNQICCKVAPALATGCTVVLKPSEVTPLSAILFTEALHEAGVPPGVFNLVNGAGPSVGETLASHAEVDLVSITGSTRAGVAVARAAASSVKRVTQELGGKSANIILPDADLEAAVTHGVQKCFGNAGQSCTSPSRMFVHESRVAEAVSIATRIAESLQPGDPRDEDTAMGPVANAAQFERVQAMIRTGIDEGATLVCGGIGRPAGLDTGYYVQPTVFSDVRNDMTIAREEIFGPVLAILPYSSEDEAVEMANDSDYGLSGCVYAGDLEHAIAVASRLRTGQVHLNGAGADLSAPFGGYKKSGNGREWGPEGFREFLESKALMGAYP
jgi:aldehyde dehydrogenase (NAD+)